MIVPNLMLSETDLICLHTIHIALYLAIPCAEAKTSLTALLYLPLSPLLAMHSSPPKLSVCKKKLPFTILQCPPVFNVLNVLWTLSSWVKVSDCVPYPCLLFYILPRVSSHLQRSREYNPFIHPILVAETL